MQSSGIEWTTTDPNGKVVVLFTSTIEARNRAGKHPGPDKLAPEDAKRVITSPHIIQESSSDSNRQTYYRYEREVGKPPYLRTTVSFDVPETAEYDAVTISYSRQSKLATGRIIHMDVKKGGAK